MKELQTIKSRMLNDLKGIERNEITEDHVEKALKANFFDTLMRSDEDQKLAEWFQNLGQYEEIHSNPVGSIQIGFFQISFHENYVDSGSDDYVYTYRIEQNEWTN